MQQNGRNTLLIAASLFCFGVLYSAPMVKGAEEPSIGPAGPILAQHGFEENKGQVRATTGGEATYVRYRLVQGSTSIFLLNSGIAYQFNRTHYPEGFTDLMSNADPDDHSWTAGMEAIGPVREETYRMDMLLEGMQLNGKVTTEDRSKDHINYYTHDALDVHSYGKVTYHDVYPGIDWVIYTTGSGMKYDFVVHPGADPDAIRLRFKHHEELHVNTSGDLVHGNCMGSFTEKRPVSFQNGKEVGTRFVLENDLLRFELNEYDPNQTLTIDPERVWGTYYGVANNIMPYGDHGHDCATDAAGNVYMTGYVYSSGGDIASGGYQNTPSAGNLIGGDGDGFLVKFAPDGTRSWATYYSGTPYSCAVDLAGNVFLTGGTKSTTGVAENGHSNTMHGDTDAFLAKFSPTGTRLWGTYYGGNSQMGAVQLDRSERGLGLAVDAEGNVYMAGMFDFYQDEFHYEAGGHQPDGSGNRDARLVKFSPDGVRLWGTFYGSGDDFGLACAVGPDGSVYLSGATSGQNGVGADGHQNTYGGGTHDAFLVKFTASGTREWGTYYGGSGQDLGYSCAVDSDGNVILAGRTGSANGIADGGHQSTIGGTTDAFLVKFAPNGQRLWGTYYGGSSVDGLPTGNGGFIGEHPGAACTVDPSGNIFLTGATNSTNAIADAGFQQTPGKGFLAMFAPNGARLWGSYYNGEGRSCSVDGDDHVYMAGTTNSATGVGENGHQNAYADVGGFSANFSDAFLVKFTTSPSTGAMEFAQPATSLLRAWPNPTSEQLNMDGLPNGICTVELVDAQGRTVLREKHTAIGAPLVISVRDLRDGVYQVRVQNGVDLFRSTAVVRH